MFVCAPAHVFVCGFEGFAVVLECAGHPMGICQRRWVPDIHWSQGGGLWMPPVVCEERGDSSGCGGGIVCVFCHWEEVASIALLVVHKGAEAGLDHLAHAPGLSAGQRVEYRGRPRA